MPWSLVEYYRRFREPWCHCHQFTKATFQRTTVPLSSVHKSDDPENLAATVISSQIRRFRNPSCLYHQFIKPAFQRTPLHLSPVYNTRNSLNPSCHYHQFTIPTSLRILLVLRHGRKIIYPNGGEGGSVFIRNVGNPAKLHGVTSH